MKRLSRQRPADPRRAKQACLDDHAVKRGDDEDVGPPQAVMTMNDGREDKLAGALGRCSGQAQNRKPEIEMAVVFAQDDL